MDCNNINVAVIGCGVMGSSIVDGWISNKIFEPKQLILTEANSEGLSRLNQRYPSSIITDDNVKAINSADLILLCLKPNFVKRFLTSLPFGTFDNKTIISIVAGIKLKEYYELLKNNHKNYSVNDKVDF
jgi:pyrroline-5-carboxylate reductase